MKCYEVGTTLKHTGIINGNIKLLIYFKYTDRKGKIKENANFYFKKLLLPVMASSIFSR